MNFLATIGAAVIILLFGFALGLALAVWKAWWLLPLWDRVLVPLGVPTITFWPLVALFSFLAQFQRHGPDDYQRAEDGWKHNLYAMAGHALAPPVVYVYILWVLS